MRVLLAIVTATAMMLPAAGVADMTLATDGNTEYVITVAADAITPEQTAAKELQAHLQQVTGAVFHIRQEGEVADTASRIVVGPCAQFHRACPDVAMEDLQHDGIVMRTVRGSLYLAGDRPRGTLYAVHTFLEDVVGCRWWSSTESFVPEKPTLTIPDLNTVYVPKLRCREAFYRDAFDGVFAARSKCNGHFARIPPEYGGHYRITGWCHTFYRILPPDKYFEKHPEWYSEIDGKRVRERAQLCLTNEEMRKEFIKNALDLVRKEPDAGIISISQNDGRGRCQCQECMAVEAHEGSASGPLIHFVNAVAEEIEKEFPDVLVETLAYSYTRQAPQHVKPRENMVIRLCSIECSFSQPLATGPQNESFRRDIEQWSAIAPKLYIWNYVTNFRNYILPHPNMRVLAPNLRFFVDHNAVALFEQGDSGSTCGDFVELRAWLLSHLMWDPSRDENALTKDFLSGYYGPAAEPLEEYLDLIHDAVEEAGTYLRCYMSDTSAWLSTEDQIRASRLFEEAQRRVADDPVLSTRVRRARMPLDNAWLLRHRGLKRVLKADPAGLFGFHDPKDFAESFIQAAHDFNCPNYREGRPFSEYEQMLRGRFRDPGPPPEMCKDLPEDRWVDVQDNEFNLHAVGRWAMFAEDEKASDQGAARLTTNHTQWAVQFPVPADISELGRLHCYAVIRCAARAEEGPALDLGIYDTDAKKGVFHATRTIEEMGAGEYQVVDMGVHELRPTMYFWFAPKANPDQVEAIFVDRIFFIRED